MKTILTIAALLIAQVSWAFIAPTNPPPQVQLAWSPVTDSTVTNVNVYYGVAPGSYTNVVAAGMATNATITLPTRGVTYYFAATSVSTGGLESVFSNEVSYTPPNPPAPPALKPLIILHVQASPTPTGQYADAGMNWTLSPDQGGQYFRLQLATAGPQPSPQLKAIAALRAAMGPPLPGQ